MSFELDPGAVPDRPSLSLRALRVVGWRTVVTGLALWLFISVASLLAIRCLNLAS